MDWLFDQRTRCWSLLTTMSIRDYLELVAEAHQTQGALSGQRDTLTTTTAKRIRARMVSDLKQGAVLPPLVIGVVVDGEKYDSLPLESATTVQEVLSQGDRSTLSIIDGMQRTAALLEAVSEESSVTDRCVRVEFWLANAVRAMIYRMLVLNTGQVPWTMNRQLTVVFAPLLQEIRANVPELDKVSTPDNPGRRVGAAQYSSDSIVELYIAFSLRKTAVDTKEAVSDEFSRLDFVENLSDERFQPQFYGALSLLARLDKVFSAYEDGPQGRFAKGRGVFDSQPARIGFMVAVATAVLGRPGTQRDPDERSAKLTELLTASTQLETTLANFNHERLGDFLRLDVLQEVLDRRVGQVGRYERSVFAEAFKVLVEENFELENMEQCWRAN
jgi:hypothetical protein